MPQKYAEMSHDCKSVKSLLNLKVIFNVYFWATENVRKPLQHRCVDHYSYTCLLLNLITNFYIFQFICGDMGGCG